MSLYSYLEYPKDILLETPLGVVTLVVPQADYVIVNTEYRKPITVNKVEYTLSLRLKKYADGWNLEKSDNGSTYHSLSAMRLDWTKINSAYASDAARTKIKSVLIPLVEKWVEDNADVIAQAEFVKLNNQAYTTEQEVNKLRNLLITTEQKLQEQIALLEQQENLLEQMKK